MFTRILLLFLFQEIPEDLEVYHEAMYIEKDGKVHEVIN